MLSLTLGFLASRHKKSTDFGAFFVPSGYPLQPHTPHASRVSCGASATIPLACAPEGRKG
jgi:hypothetical protein